MTSFELTIRQWAKEHNANADKLVSCWLPKLSWQFRRDATDLDLRKELDIANQGVSHPDLLWMTESEALAAGLI